MADDMLAKDEMEICDDLIRQRLTEEQKRLGKSDEYIGNLALAGLKAPE